MFIVFSGSRLSIYIELCIFLSRLVLFVSTLAKGLAGKTTTRDIFRVEGFPLQRPDGRVIDCNEFFSVFATRNIFNCFIDFTFCKLQHYF